MKQVQCKAPRVVANRKRYYYNVRQERQTRNICRPIYYVKICGRFRRRFVEKITEFSKVFPIRSRQYLKICSRIVNSEENFMWKRIKNIFEIESHLQDYHECVHSIETRISNVQQDQKEIKKRICQFLSLEEEENQEDTEKESSRNKLSNNKEILDEWPDEIEVPILCNDPRRLKEAFESLYNRMEFLYDVGIMIDNRWDLISKALTDVRGRIENLNDHLNKIEKTQEWFFFVFSLPKYQLLSAAANTDSNSDNNKELRICHHRFVSGRSH